VPDLDVRAHLEREYEGVFASGQVERHIEGYVALDAAAPLVDLVCERLAPGDTVLDVGCGYGAFVTLARERGMDARGIELAAFEIDYARERFAERDPNGDPQKLFVNGDALSLPNGDDTVDAVTFWNVIEHVGDWGRALEEAERVLRPGGWLFVIAPNYASFRREAHYHVPWVPLFPRPMARTYLRMLGRDPRFFDEAIHYCTTSAVRRRIRGLGLELVDRRAERLSEAGRIENPKVRRAMTALSTVGLGGLAPAVARGLAANPMAPTISIEARKPADSASGLRTP
jgi:SAM-dependent methyltransferase